MTTPQPHHDTVVHPVQRWHLCKTCGGRLIYTGYIHGSSEHFVRIHKCDSCGEKSEVPQEEAASGSIVYVDALGQVLA